NIILQYLFKKEGLEPIGEGTPGDQQVKLVGMAPSDMLPAMATGRVAGYIVAEPFVALSEVRNIGRVLRFTGDVWKEHACCVVMMHEHDLEARSKWSQTVVNGIVEAQAWVRENRKESARLLSRAGAQRYMPDTEEVLAKVLAPSPEDNAFHASTGAIRHGEWDSHRIDFQPYPYPSYTERM